MMESFSKNNNDDDSTSSRRAVRFFPKVQIHTIPSLKDSPEHIGKIYYTKEDLAEQMAEYVATAKAMHRRHRRGEDPLQVHEVKIRQETQQECSIVTTSTTTRGLENMVSIDLHRQEQSDIIDVVLLAQENGYTPKEIATLYGHRARLAKKRARNYGLADAKL